MTTRTEPPSPRRLRQARESGDYPRSGLLKRGLVWAVALCTVPRAASSLWTYGQDHILSAIRNSSVSAADLGRLATMELNKVLLLSLPVLTVALVANVATHVVESRGTFVAQLPRPRLLAPLISMYSFRALASVALHWLCFALLTTYAWLWFQRHAVSLSATLGHPWQARELASSTALHFAWVSGVLWCACGSIDLFIAHRAWLRRLGMSSTEKRREQLEQGNNPWLAQQRIERHRDATMISALNALHDATLVIHSRFETVVLLRYIPEQDQAPRVLGMAAGALARHCIDEAANLGIATFDDESLTRALARCKLDTVIPESLYDRVAEVLAWVPGATRATSLDAELAPRLLRT